MRETRVLFRLFATPRNRLAMTLLPLVLTLAAALTLAG